MADEWDICFDVVCIGDVERADLLEDCGMWAFVRGDEYVVVYVL